MRNIIAERVLHKGISRIVLRFPFDSELIMVVKGLSDAKWSQVMGCWHIEDSPHVITLLLKAFYGKAFIDYSALKPNLAEKIRVKKEEDQRKLKLRSKGTRDTDFPLLSDKGKGDIEKYRRWMESHRYPETTIKTYTGMVSTFLRFISPKEASECTTDDLVRLVDEYILPEGLSYSYQNQMVSAVKKFYDKLYRSVIEPCEFTRPRPQHRLPNVLSKEEVKKILDSPLNEKHRVMLSLIYACGLRRSELMELVPGDLERDRKLLRIRQAKGFKDRVVPLSEKVIQMTDLYISRFKPEKYLFEGQYPGCRYSASSLDKVFKDALRKAGLRREVTLHGLRHSYATHLLEAGTDLRYIQELLGHKSSRTTEIYTHVTTKSIQKIRSSFDDL
jgi:integrase/recombinase XerD